jgi:ankyrin repeat protein
MLAAEGGQIEAVEALLEAGADLKGKGKDGRTALMRAAGGRHTRVVELLKDAGARK